MHELQNVRRRFFVLASVNILTNLTVPLAGLVDTAILGHLPDIRFLAGVALGTLVFDYLTWGLGFLRMGTTGLTAQAHGLGDAAGDREVQRVLQRGLLLALAIGGALVLFQRPLEDLSFALLVGDPEVEAAGREYYQARIWGVPAGLLNLVFLGWFLGREESRVALVMTAVASVANIVLDVVLILWLDLAAWGAGLATMISQYLMLAVAVAYYLPRRPRGPWPWSEILDRQKLRELFVLQIDILIRTLCLVTGFAIFVNLSALLGTGILAANTVLLRLFTFSAFFIDGAAFATETLAGIAHGKGRTHQLRQVLWLALATAFVFGAGFALAALFFPQAIFGALTSHADVVALATSRRGWLALTLVLGSAAFILDGFFVGLTAGRTLRNAMLWSLAAFLPFAALALWLEAPHLPWLALLVLTVARALTLGRAVIRLPGFAGRQPAQEG